MIRKITCLLLAVGTAAILAGCGTSSPPPGNRLYVTLIPPKQFELNGEQADVDRLAKRLRSAGAKTDTAIVVSIPAETPSATIAFITKDLSAAGFRRVIFAKPRRAEVDLQTGQKP